MTAHTKASLLSGKLPAALLADLITELPTSSPSLLLGPALGEDAAVIDFAQGCDRLLVAKSDPITFATDEIGYYAVNICVNDLAVTGATPRYYLPTLLLPAGGVREELVRSIFRQIGEACAEFGIVVAGGHSEITHAVTQPIVAGTLLGEAPRDGYISSGGGSAGDVVLMAGLAPVEGTSIIAREKRSELLKAGWSQDDVEAAAAYLHHPGISVLAPAKIAAERRLVSAMHDPTEGGVVTGLVELALASGTGLAVDLDAIPIPDLSRRICSHYGLDPLGLIASGALLATTSAQNAEEVIELWRAIGWPSAVIGELTQQRRFTAYSQGKSAPMPRFDRDEITKLWE